MQRNKIGLPQQIVKAAIPGVSLYLAAVVDNIHAKSGRTAGNSLPDTPVADDASVCESSTCI